MSRRGALLIVDDCESDRTQLSRRLGQRGYDCTVAADGAAALALISRQPFDLILLGSELPDMSGLDALGRIRARHSRTDLPVMMIAECGDDPLVTEAFRSGANDFVTRPVDFTVTLARVGTHLSHKWVVEALRDSEERYSLALRGANDGLWDWNLVTQEAHFSPRWKAMLGYEDTDLSNDPNEWFARIHPDDVGKVKSTLAKHLANGHGHYESEHRIRHRDNTFKWVRCRGAAVKNADGFSTRFAGSLTDITDAKLADPLTGLPNRLLFLDLVDRAIKRTERRPKYFFGLLALGLDRFRMVHDSLGAHASDRLLVSVARRLQYCLRVTDVVTRDGAATLARLDGDEFNVLLDDISTVGDAVQVAMRLRRALEEPFEIDGHQVFLSATVGIALSKSGYSRPDDVVRDASIALTRARAASTPYEIFDPAMRERAKSRLLVETDLRHAIDKRAFELHYQPIVSLRSGRIAGFEALVRWRHPVRGLLNPAEFIPIAEDTGMILDIGRQTLAESCRQMAEWLDRFGLAAPHVICANVSSRQFADTDLMHEIAAVLKATGLTAANLKLEITESAFMNDVPAAQATLNLARSMGIAWSLDDFGTGYSSLSYLHRLQVDTVKVDRSFVREIGSDGTGCEMVRAIVGLAHTLGMDVVAEGVETAEQCARLQELGCEYAQGFYFSQPVDTETAARLIASQPWQSALSSYSSQPPPS